MHQFLKASIRHQLTSFESLVTRSLCPITAAPVTDGIRYNSSETQTHQQTKGQQLLRYWQGLLGTADDQHASDLQSAKSTWKTESIKDLLHAAIRVRHGRVSGVLPEQLLSTFIHVYRCTMGPSDRLKLFHILCNEFGVQGMLLTSHKQIVSQSLG